MVQGNGTAGEVEDLKSSLQSDHMSEKQSSKIQERNFWANFKKKGNTYLSKVGNSLIAQHVSINSLKDFMVNFKTKWFKVLDRVVPYQNYIYKNLELTTTQKNSG